MIVVVGRQFNFSSCLCVSWACSGEVVFPSKEEQQEKAAPQPLTDIAPATPELPDPKRVPVCSCGEERQTCETCHEGFLEVLQKGKLPTFALLTPELETKKTPVCACGKERATCADCAQGYVEVVQAGKPPRFSEVKQVAWKKLVLTPEVEAQLLKDKQEKEAVQKQAEADKAAEEEKERNAAEEAAAAASAAEAEEKARKAAEEAAAAAHAAEEEKAQKAAEEAAAAAKVAEEEKVRRRQLQLPKQRRRKRRAKLPRRPLQRPKQRRRKECGKLRRRLVPRPRQALRQSVPQWQRRLRRSAWSSRLAMRPCSRGRERRVRRWSA